MLKKTSITLILFIILSNALFSQGSLYIPLDIKKTYERGTRSYDGKPGSNYWQNKSDYKIRVEVDPKTKLLSGSETITYYNNSPGDLKEIIIHLYQDRNKPESPRDWSVDPKTLTDGVNIKVLKVNGVLQDLNSSYIIRSGTNLEIKLDSPLESGSSITLYFEWSFIIPVQPNPRMGYYQSGGFMIAYWYPQVAVYDDIDGWDKLDYTGSTEFYNDFSDYDVEITVPNDFCVWATGVLQNPEQVLTKEYLERYNKALTSDEVIKIIASEDYLKKSEIFSKTKSTNTWHFKAEYVPDFAFALSDRYYWDALSLESPTDGEPGRRVLIGAAYASDSRDFYEVAKIAYDVIKYFSYEFPAVPFPYPRLTVFNGAGGMEFPMMVNDGSTWSRTPAVNLTAHEIAHTYFPFYMGINERKYAWMDEGWAQMLPFDIQSRLAEENDTRARNTFRYLIIAGTEYDLPLMTPSFQMNFSSYGTASYFRPGCAYDILRSMLGRDVFDNALREYMKRWNGKHPIPYDFFFTFNDVTGQNLDWFWKPWFFEWGYPDLSIEDVKVSDKMIKVLIRKEGNIPVPIRLTFKAMDGTEAFNFQPASLWQNGNNEVWVEQVYEGPLLSIILGGPHIPDTDTSNNRYEFR